VITGLADGGAEGTLFRLCANDNQNRHVVISMMDEGKYGPLLKSVGAEVFTLDMPRGQLTLGGILRLWRLLRSQRPDLVQTWLYHADLIGGIAARLAGVKAVFWGIRNGDLSPEKNTRSTLWVARLCAALSRLVPHRILCCSERAAAVHQALGYDAERFVLIPNGYDVAQLTPNPEARKRLRAEWLIGHDEFLMGMVARFDPQKDHANLVAALARLAARQENFRCVLVGTGMDEGNVELLRWLTEAGIHDRVLLLGRRHDVPDIMSALDLHVLSSAGEAFPNVLAEAMACGTPCVTTDVGDAAMIVGNTGWVVPPGDAAALARAIEEALHHLRQPAAWAARQEAARRRIVDHFSIGRMVEAYSAAWAR